jgi:hypothetical protein
MSDEDKLLWMFEQVHGTITGSCYTEIDRDDSEDPIGISVMKDGNLCWYKTKLDIVFDYLTKPLE